MPTEHMSCDCKTSSHDLLPQRFSSDVSLLIRVRLTSTKTSNLIKKTVLCLNVNCWRLCMLYRDGCQRVTVFFNLDKSITVVPSPGPITSSLLNPLLEAKPVSNFTENV